MKNLLFILCGMIGASAYAVDNKYEGKEQKRSPAANNAQAVSSSGLVNVYRFTDTVDGQKFVCYFTESNRVHYMDSTGPVTCMALKNQ